MIRDEARPDPFSIMEPGRFLFAGGDIDDEF
jgi:hypothetical protein